MRRRNLFRGKMLSLQQNCKRMDDKFVLRDSAEVVNRKLDLLLRTGCLLMECSADTTRIMRTLKRTIAYLGLRSEHLHLYVNYTILMVNYHDDTHSYTNFRHCKKHIIDMAVISEVSRLSWRSIAEDMTLDEYEAVLSELGMKRNRYTPWQVAIGSGFACGGFCIQFGCDWVSFFYASIAAILGFRLKMYLGKRGTNVYAGTGISAFVATMIAWLFSLLSVGSLAAYTPQFLHSGTPWHPLLACALFIVPGVPLINFVSDMLDGHIETGITRATNTLLIVGAMSFGIALAIKICGINNFVTDLSMIPHHSYWEFAIAAAISAMGFSMIYSTPKRLLLPIALGGIIAVCTRNFVNLGDSNGNIGLDQGIIIGSLAGSVLISLIITRAQHWYHTPHQCLSIPSVIPMVPGVFMYRALFAFIEMDGSVDQVLFGLNNLIKASLVILCIALGVALPHIFVHRLMANKRKQRLIDSLNERNRLQLEKEGTSV